MQQNSNPSSNFIAALRLYDAYESNEYLVEILRWDILVM